MIERPLRYGRLLHCTTRYAPGSIAQPASLPQIGKYSFSLESIRTNELTMLARVGF
ncbi:hypothetical protein [Mucilaginibacter psychrotolerans]|uniref:hypothetical protein n=1 Tax=Mucilaginibacter psychrotolerans TaxID=1524096 RepID=UPI0013051C2F|nr:hypothetical protein [Mucilaginibacter psychrotolerans]